MATKPSPFEAVDSDGLRLCKTGPKCGTRYDPTKEGSKGRCNRCRMAKARGKRPGPRQRQPPGEARVELRGTVHPELHSLMKKALAANGVRDEWGLVEKLVADKFGRLDLVSPRRLAAKGR